MAEKQHIDERLKEWATPTQAKYVDLINEYGSARKAAEKAGVARGSIRDAIAGLKKRASLKGYSPEHDMVRAVPDPFIVKGISTYYNSEGVAAGQWVKSSLSSERQAEMMKAAAEAMAEELPRLPPIVRPSVFRDDLLNLYPYTDYHMGMLAWGKEAGEPWDIDIAERLLIDSFEQMIAQSPAARTCLIAQMGDFLHYDSLDAVTPAHKNLLDADGRFSKMVAASIRVQRRICDIALMKHEEVLLIEAEGNHDPASSVWLRHMFKALYENEPRLTVNDSELPYYAERFGNTMLTVHHGHLLKNANLPLLFAAMYPEMWGATTKRYCHTGHRHHSDEKEYAGMKLMQLPTLAAKDSYAARNGYLSEREVTAFTYHRKYGLVGRTIITPEMCQDANELKAAA